MLSCKGCNSISGPSCFLSAVLVYHNIIFVLIGLNLSLGTIVTVHCRAMEYRRAYYWPIVPV